MLVGVSTKCCRTTRRKPLWRAGGSRGCRRAHGHGWHTETASIESILSKCANLRRDAVLNCPQQVRFPGLCHTGFQIFGAPHHRNLLGLGSSHQSLRNKPFLWHTQGMLPLPTTAVCQQTYCRSSQRQPGTYLSPEDTSHQPDSNWYQTQVAGVTQSSSRNTYASLAKITR